MNRSIAAAACRCALGMVLGGSLLAGSASAQPATKPGVRKPQVWAVIVGVELYDDGDIPRCPGAKRDAAALVRWFSEAARWNSSNVLLMNDSSGSKL